MASKAEEVKTLNASQDERAQRNFLKQLSDRFGAAEAAIRQQAVRLRRLENATSEGKMKRSGLRADFDGAKTYAGVILGIGFGGFFALWSMLKNEPFPRLHAIAGMAIGLALLFYVVWEVLQMVTLAIAARRAAESGNFGEDWLQGERAAITKLLRQWPWFVGATVFFGLVAAGCLFAMLGSRIFSAFY